MCDTIGKIGNKNRDSIFAKNSDRQYDEPQVMVFIKGKKNIDKKLKTTYIEIEQVENTHTILISKPVWMWGAEMGVNDCGVCIGNEAISTKTAKENEKALIGMDLVRLGLERSSSAKEAVDVIIGLLKKYGQGGNCGYNKEQYYDNSFLIMDRNELYILETVGKNYAVKSKKMASISNCLTIRNADRYNDVKNFRKKYTDKSHKSGKYRRKATYKKLIFATNKEDFFKIMRFHFKNSKKDSICMHGEYETANSMVVILKERPEIYFTGCPNPCKSEYKKYIFGEQIEYPIVDEENQENCEYWKNKRYK